MIIKEDFKYLIEKHGKSSDFNSQNHQIRSNNLLNQSNSDVLFLKFGYFENADFIIPLSKLTKSISINNNNKYEGYLDWHITRLVLNIIKFKDAELFIYDSLENGQSYKPLYSLSNAIFKNKTNVYEIYEFTKIIDEFIKQNLNFEKKKTRIILINNLDYEKNKNLKEKLNILTKQIENNNYFLLYVDSLQQHNLNIDDPTVTKSIFLNVTKSLSIKYESIENEVSNILKEISSSNSINIIENKQKDDIEIPIGNYDDNTDFYFRLGKISDNYHAIIGGQSGKGKSVLLNNIIANGIKDFPQNELQFFLVDCKGTEFLEYVDFNSKHILKVKSTSNIDELYETIIEIEKIRKDREEFLRDVSKSKNIDVHNQKNPDTKLSRILIIIDEFQHLFTGQSKVSNHIEKILVTDIIRTGRGFGIHLIVATQSLGDGVRRSFLENIPLRIALGMTANQSTSFLHMKNDKAGNLQKGKAIYNPNNGELEFNELVNISNITEEQIKYILENDKD